MDLAIILLFRPH